MIIVEVRKEVRVTGVSKRPAGPEKDDMNDVTVERSETVVINYVLSNEVRQ
jgi:hypothetical protein